MQTILDLRAVVQAVGDAVVACDETGAITLWNPAAERIFGFTQAEALGASLDIIIPERMRKRHWDGYYETMRTGITRYGNDVLRVPAINKAGGALSISFTVAMLFSPDHKVSSILAVMRDETARFNEDRAIVRDNGLTVTTPTSETAADGAASGGCPFGGQTPT
jgi:PAS domain S-box-containing protein